MTRNQVSPAPSSDLSDAQPSRKEVPFVSGRLALLFLAFFAIMALFATQIYRLTVLQGPYYRSESENNFRTEVPIIAPRGKIYDRNRLPLAINERVFDVAMSPFNLTREEIETTVQRLAVLLNRPQLADRAEAVASLRPRWKSLTLVRDLQLDEVLPVQEQAFLLPGVIVQRSYRRIYPAGELAGNITGHVGMMSDRAEIAAFEARGYLRTEKIGRLNAEQSFETLLHGRNGLEEVFRDARGKPRSSPRIIEQAQPGQTLILTLDLGLQQLAHALLEGHNGVIIAMDPRDGAILAMAQRPNYDPNRPTQGYQVNKAYRGLYPPGSTFKIVTAAAGLKAGHLPTESVYCNGAIYLSRWRFPCHLRWGHGSETLYDALMHSFNVYFYTWARAGNIGFQGIVEAAGVVRSPATGSTGAAGTRKRGAAGHARQQPAGRCGAASVDRSGRADRRDAAADGACVCRVVQRRAACAPVYHQGHPKSDR